MKQFKIDGSLFIITYNLYKKKEQVYIKDFNVKKKKAQDEKKIG